MSRAAALAKYAIPEPNTGCVLWLGTVTEQGYGKVWIPDLRQRRFAHRIAWELEHGPVPEGLQLDHLCRNRLCLNPAHLEAVTPLINTLRSESPSAKNAAKAVCPCGLEYSHTVSEGRPKRVCVVCQAERSREHYEKNRAAILARKHARDLRARWLKLASQLNLSAAPLSNPPSSDVSDAGRPSVSEFSGGSR